MFSTHTIETASIHSFFSFRFPCTLPFSLLVRAFALSLYLLLMFHSLTTPYFRFFIWQRFGFYCSPAAFAATHQFYVHRRLAISRFTVHHKIAVSSRNLFNFQQCKKSSSHRKILFHSLCSLACFVPASKDEYTMRDHEVVACATIRFDSLVGFKLMLLMTVSRTASPLQTQSTQECTLRDHYYEYYFSRMTLFSVWPLQQSTVFFLHVGPHMKWHDECLSKFTKFTLIFIVFKLWSIF